MMCHPIVIPFIRATFPITVQSFGVVMPLVDA